MTGILLALLLSAPVEIPGLAQAELHRPQGAGPFPAVLLIQGWWAVEPWDESSADRLAKGGRLVLRVMPERGQRPEGRDAMHALMTGPPNEKSLAGLRAARKWLLERGDVRGSRIAVLGARMGGRDALVLADDPGVAGVVSWYGMPPRQAPKGAALAFFGGQDMGPSADDARRFAAAAKGTATEVRIYPEAQHGFADPQNPWGGYDETAARDSWARAVAFLDARLAEPGVSDANAAAPVAAATGGGSRAAVDCVVAAWNAYDVEAARKCYADDAVSRNAHGVVPIDWAFERGLRAFDRVARSKFRAEVRQADGSNVDFTLHETSDFIAALGLESVTAIWRYTVKDGRVAEEDLQQADAAFRTSVRKLTQWGRSTKPAGWESVVDSEGIIRFDGTTAPTLVRLAKEWSTAR